MIHKKVMICIRGQVIYDLRVLKIKMGTFIMNLLFIQKCLIIFMGNLKKSYLESLVYLD